MRQMALTQQVQHALKKFSPFPMPISQLYHILLEERLVAPIFPKRIIDPPPGKFGSFKTCEYHLGSLGHSSLDGRSKA